MIHDFTVWYVSTLLAVSFRTLSVYNYIVVVVSNIYLSSGEFEIKQMDQLLEELCSDRWYVINFFKIPVNLQFCADADRKDLHLTLCHHPFYQYPYFTANRWCSLATGILLPRSRVVCY